MTGFFIAGLLGLSAMLLVPPSRIPMQLAPAAGHRESSDGRETTRREGGMQDGSRQRRRSPLHNLLLGLRRSRPDSALQEVPLLIHQLTGLLAAGRAPHQLWADAAALQSAAGKRDGDALSARLLPVLEAAASAASLGLSPVPVFEAAAQDRAGRALKTHHTGNRGGAASLSGLWAGLAACVRVSERSGAPLAGVLSRYAAQLEAGLDSQAARETAMAGPQATVRLLTWLPVGGLGLGYLLGADPVGILLGSPLGWLAGTAGVALSLAGRFWSRALVRQAAGA